MLQTLLGTLLLSGLGACAAAPDERALTPLEKQQILREWERSQLQKDLGQARCGASSKMAQTQARASEYRGADAFDARNCPRPVGDAPAK